MELDFANNNQAPIRPGQQPMPVNQPNHPPSPTPPPPAPAPLPPAPPPAPPQSQSFASAGPEFSEPSSGPSMMLILLIVVGLLLVAGGVGGYLFIKSKKSQTPPNTTDTIPNGPSTNGTTTVDPLVANRDKQRKQHLAEIQGYLESYYQENKSYPVAQAFQRFDDLNSVVYKSLIGKYASSIPIEPLAPDYWYGYRSVDGKTFELTAQLENKDDAEGAYDLSGVFLYTLTPGLTSGTTSSEGSSLPTGSFGSSN